MKATLARIEKELVPNLKFIAKLVAVDAGLCRLRQLTPEQVVASKKVTSQFRCGGDVHLEVTTREQAITMSCDPCCWTRGVDGVDRGSVVIALVVVNNAMGREFWAVKGLATIDVTGTSEAEEALLAYLSTVNEKLLDWKSSFEKSGVQGGVEVIHRFRQQLLDIDEAFSRWAKEQLNKMRSQQPAEDHVSWPPSLHCPVPNHPLQATPVIQHTDASMQILCRELKSITEEAFAQHCIEVDEALQECVQSFSAFKTAQGMSRLPEASEVVEHSRLGLWKDVSSLLVFKAAEVGAISASQAPTSKASAVFPPNLLHQLRLFVVPYDARALQEATNLVNGVLRQACGLQEAILEEHLLRDVLVQNQVEKAFLAYLSEVNEKLLDWKCSFEKSGMQSGVEVIHRFREQLLDIDETCSKWGKEQLDKMRSQQPAEDHVSWPPSLQCPLPNHLLQVTSIVEHTDASMQNLCRDLESTMAEEAFVQHCLKVDRALQECRLSFSAFNMAPGTHRLPQPSEVVEHACTRLWEDVSSLRERKSKKVLDSMQNLRRDLKSIMAEEAFVQHCIEVDEALQECVQSFSAFKTAQGMSRLPEASEVVEHSRLGLWKDVSSLLVFKAAEVGAISASQAPTSKASAVFPPSLLHQLRPFVVPYDARALQEATNLVNGVLRQACGLQEAILEEHLLRDVLVQNQVEKAFLAYLSEVNEKLLDWKCSFEKSGMQSGVEVIHRFREQLLDIDETCSKWGKEQLDKMRSQQPAEDHVSWPPSLQCPLPNHLLQVTSIVEHTDASMQNLCRDPEFIMAED
ncbi:unnamed protein product [Symbiodinium sp. CCMP2592]|nr:unnamed protein product [Symbiodinium sp. CCMP2592]